MRNFVWKKLGCIFAPQGEVHWMQSHAMLPTLEQINSHLTRLYFASRNDENQSHIGVLEFNLETLKIQKLSTDLLLAPGELGTFDDNGVLPSCIISTDTGKFMYYIGFKPGGTTRMDLFGGLAKFIGENQLERVSQAPILERNAVNPYINTAPFVINNHGSSSDYKYFMYYVAGCGWIHKDLPKYNIQIAFSHDGLNWFREGKVCIDFQDEHEVALARPWTIFINNKYHMWFSYKGNAYRIGYAVSDDGITWSRQDHMGGLLASDVNKDFDSNMVCYGAVMQHKHKLFMFYNGNDYGCSGIGLAVADV